MSKSMENAVVQHYKVKPSVAQKILQIGTIILVPIFTVLSYILLIDKHGSNTAVYTILIFILFSAIAYVCNIATTTNYRMIFERGTFTIYKLTWINTTNKVVSFKTNQISILAKLSDTNKELITGKFKYELHCEHRADSPYIWFAITGSGDHRKITYFDPSIRVIESFREYMPPEKMFD